MSDTVPTTNLTLKIADQGMSTEVLTQYGMRYPNGAVQWTADSSGMISFEKLHAGHAEAANRWNEKLRQQANAAAINVEEYAAQHQLIKRHVIVAITNIEDV